MPRRPDFFIVGAPKCGTTAMAGYLGQHPEIGMCPRKETHFLAGSEMWRSIGRNAGASPLSLDRYLDLFAGLEDRKRLGEASVWYLYSTAAAAEIESFSPGAEIIAMLRNPVEMIPSLHSQLVFGGMEPEEDFDRALALDPERERSGTPPAFPPASYRSAASYAEQLERYLEVFGRERVHVIAYDDFRDDTLGCFRATCGALGVDAEFAPDIEVINPNKRVKSRAVRRLERRPPQPLRRVLHSVTSEDFRRRAGRRMRRWNTSFGPREPLAAVTERELHSIAARQVSELRALLGLELDAWLD